MLCFVTLFFLYLPSSCPSFTFYLPFTASSQTVLILFLFIFYVLIRLSSQHMFYSGVQHSQSHSQSHTHTLASNYYYDFYQSLPDVDWSYCAFNVRINNKPSKVHYQLVMVEMVIKLFYRACHPLWWGVVFAVIVSLESVKRPCFAIVGDDHNWSALILSMSVIWCCSDHVTW